MPKIIDYQPENFRGMHFQDKKGYLCVIDNYVQLDGLGWFFLVRMLNSNFSHTTYYVSEDKFFESMTKTQNLHSINEYQRQALETFAGNTWDKNQQIMYATLGVANEAGEVAGKIKKIIRDHDGNFSDDKLRLEIIKELGDVLWYTSVLAWLLGYSLYGVALQNIMKLADRKLRNVIKGNGDDR